MCGFVGEFLIADDAVPTAPEIMSKMGETLRHRGPDGSGQEEGDYWCLHHRRLAIIDLVSGAQPLFSPDNQTVIAFNGEIYNYQELRQELLEKGHTFRTATDTEVLLHGYQEWGEDLPVRLRGMFAFALVDKKHKRLLLGRDRLGQKPLYIARMPGRLLFASEPKALLAHPLVGNRIDTGSLWESLIFRYVPDPHCIFKGMEKLAPANILSADCRGYISRRRYWDISFAEPSGEKPGVLAEKLLETLDQSVSMRLMAEVPLGAFLSSGLDSAALAASMKQSRDDVTAISVGFGEKEFDERAGARITADLLGLELREHETRAAAAADLEVLADHFDEPFFDSSALPTYHVCRQARKEVTVALSGDGGDEAFAGYRRYRFDRHENRVRACLPPGVGSLLAHIGRGWPRSPGLPRPLRAGATLENLGRSPFFAYLNSVSAIAPEAALNMLAPEIRTALKDYDPLAIHQHHFNSAGPVDPLSRVQYMDLMTYLPGDILVKVDRASMAVSLEARAPLLDHHFLALAATVPPGYRIRHGQGKWIFRESVRKRLGTEILNRPKMGFSVPLSQWIRNDFAQATANALAGEAAQALLDVPRLRNWRLQHIEGKRDHSAALWVLMVLDRWWLRWGG